MSSELDPRKGLGLYYTVHRPNAVHNDLAEGVVVLGRHLSYQVIFTEQRMELYDLVHVEQLVVDPVLLGGGRAYQYEAYCRVDPPFTVVLSTGYNFPPFGARGPIASSLSVTHDSPSIYRNQVLD